MNAGKVYLIGAGPGAADLISVRGRRALQMADAVLVDQLLPRNFLDELEISTADKCVVWLADASPRWTQGKINGWLVSQARQDRRVARLKGGDPFVFGQAEEETRHLSHWDVPWEAIPGPSSFTAVLTSAGFPLTRRRRGRGFAVATARTAGGSVADRFPKADSLVIMMGVGALDQMVAALLADGWAVDAPAAAVESGTLPWERHVTCSLSSLAAGAKAAGISSPACVIVGEAALRVGEGRARPTILFTGLDPTHFRTLGHLVHWPALETAADQGARRRLRQICSAGLDSRFDWIFFTDRLGVASFFEELRRLGLDGRALAGVKIAAVGISAAQRLGEQGLRPDRVLETHAFDRPHESSCDFKGGSVLMVEGTHVSRRLHDAIFDPEARVRHLVLNRAAPHRQLGRALPDHDVIYFVSPSGVRSYLSAYGLAAFEKETWCLGEETQGVLAEHGISASVVTADKRRGILSLASA
ncbi:MAG TPA: uroporphyrinogen-III C-methyltransferase [Thermoguttaceae bacterium]|nr:uroporphyrinogen-III C-methyltransferase [Thermoguttaceae bacterium]